MSIVYTLFFANKLHGKSARNVQRLLYQLVVIEPLKIRRPAVRIDDTPNLCIVLILARQKFLTLIHKLAIKLRRCLEQNVCRRMRVFDRVHIAVLHRCHKRIDDASVLLCKIGIHRDYRRVKVEYLVDVLKCEVIDVVVLHDRILNSPRFKHPYRIEKIRFEALYLVVCAVGNHLDL